MDVPYDVLERETRKIIGLACEGATIRFNSDVTITAESTRVQGRVWVTFEREFTFSDDSFSISTDKLPATRARLVIHDLLKRPGVWYSVTKPGEPMGRVYPFRPDDE
jgi:hypothetical protein